MDLSHGTPGTTGRPHILVVDDEPHIQRLVEACLQPAGYRVTSVSSIAEARLVVEADQPTLVLLDFTVPLTRPASEALPAHNQAQRTWSELFEHALRFSDELREGEATAGLPVILLGAKWADVTHWRQTIPPLLAPAQRPVIHKPFNPAELAALVTRVLAGGEAAASAWIPST